eukprot:CAMPEP_0194301144 /NCGR_PEP_ID=MMETSP0169-20130528/61637_1 /TAXON_ID=218684 /ORGANISM="Corethron pennatum, Strain L29A3" /LENGTH=491 /DNA_ID=CAMNT_0039051369 /DNA_START=810 /DNA_END=2282 /DNA_ORIENTATION=+
MVYSKSFIDDVSNFFSLASSGTGGVLRNQLRNAATPFAHKAQLALAMSTTVSLHINCDAPKLWVPISSKRADGALFLDAGRFRMVYHQKEKETNCCWEVHASDMQLKFVSSELNRGSLGGKNEIPVIEPFDIKIIARLVGESVERFKEATCINVIVGKIMLNLVDVEVVATAVSRLYAVLMVAKKSDVKTSDESIKKKFRKAKKKAKKIQLKLESQQYKVSVVLEKIEMCVEGFTSSLSLSALTFMRRTYDVSLCGIRIDHSRMDEVTRSSFTVDDISVVQIHNCGVDINLPMFVDNTSERQSIFIRASESHILDLIPTRENDEEWQGPAFTRNSYRTPVKSSLPESHRKVDTDDKLLPYFIEVCYFHDGSKHLTEIEVDVGPFITFITPTSLRDISLGCNRIAEIVQVMTKEIERKVHKEGRLARDKQEHSQSGSRKARDDLTDSSVLFKVTMRNATLLAGKPLTKAISPIKLQDSNDNQDKIATEAESK